MNQNRSIVIGGQNGYWRSPAGGWYFGTKTFFYRQQHGKIEDSWVPQGVRVGGGHARRLQFAVGWLPVSEILAADFDDLSAHFHFTENLLDRIAKVRLVIDSYVFVDTEMPSIGIECAKPSLGWPSQLTEEQAAVRWQFCRVGGITFDRLPQTEDQWGS